MSDITTAYGALQTMTVTNLHSLASSATAGWQSTVVQNTSGYTDAHVQVVVDFANTAPANAQQVYVFAYGGIESGVYSNPATGSEGTITLTNVTTTPQNLRTLGSIPYTTQDEVAESSPMSVAAAFGGTLPLFWGLVIINYSGAALAASGNTVKWLPIYGSISA